MTRSLHDNFVLGYSVDAEAARIVLRTEYRDAGEPYERTNARFEGVIGYLFRDNLGGILFDITEEPFEYILRDHEAEFAMLIPYGWPWAVMSTSKPQAYVNATGSKAFCVQSTIGFDGFVIAKSLVIEAAEESTP